MNNFLVIAVLALTGFSLASAASLNFGDNEVTGSIEDLKESLQTLLRGAPEKTVEDVTSFDDFDEEIKPVDDLSTVVTLEEEESTALNVNSTGSDNNGILCRWHGYVGICCMRVHFHGVLIPICVKDGVRPHYGMHVSLQLFGHHVWSHWLYNHRRYKVCWHNRYISLCIVFDHLSVSSRYEHMCMTFYGRYHYKWYHAHLGCLTTHFAAIENGDRFKPKVTQAE